MRRLREAGYTLEAIREALAVAGLRVGKSTVQRELSRKPRRNLLAIQAPSVALPQQNEPPRESRRLLRLRMEPI
jgi:hypothetical protein